MTKKAEKNLIVGLDIGTSKVVAIVGEVKPAREIEVIGIGSHPSRGLKKGVVVNIESTVQSIQRAVEEAELMAGCEIHSVHAGIAGSHIRSLNSHGIVAIKDSEVAYGDVERVIDAARAVAIPADQKILEQLSSSYAVLSDDEKELGVCLVDIGGGTTDIAIFTDGSIRHTSVIPIAGDQVTNDIAVALRTPTQHAEDIKVKYACALTQLAADDETIEVPSIGDRPARRLSRQTLAEVVEPRYEELLTLVQAELRRSGFEDLIPGGVVLTGGSSKMEGLIDLAEEVFHMPVRLGVPQYITGLVDVVRNPIYATGVGLLLFGSSNRATHMRELPNGPGMNDVWGRMRSWFQGNF